MIDTMHIGSFEVLSGKMQVTDPCYNRGTWCQGVLENVMNGKWVASVEIVPNSMTGWGDRIGKIIVKNNDGVPKNYHTLEAEIGVDSGQAGFFCDSGYPQEHTGEYDDEETFYAFYGKICELTMTEQKSGVLSFGAVSSSGFGDGGYVCNYWTDSDGTVIQAEIVFITDEDFEDDSTDDEFDL